MSNYIGLAIQGRKITKALKEVVVRGCPEVLVVALFDDGFYGVVAEKGGQLRYFDAYPLNPQFTQLAACMEQVPEIEEPIPAPHSRHEVLIKVSSDYKLLFDINMGTPDCWHLRGVEPLSVQPPTSGHPLDGANLEKLNSMLFDAGAIKRS